MKASRSNGFSLLELAISLAVLAVLTGGALKGRELIRSAKVQSTVTEIASLETALSAFESRYAALPGDFPAGKAAGLDSSGNGNFLIETKEEIGAFWHHLASAGFIRGSYDGLPVTELDCPASTCRTSPLGGTMKVSTSSNLANLNANRLLVNLGEDQPASLLAELDRKLDDGKPESGQLRVLEDWKDGCTTDTGFWDEAQDPLCRAAYVLR